jgi:serine/threonine-protein kinase RsbW
MIGRSELRVACRVDVSTVKLMRQALGSFLAAFVLDRELLEDILLATSEVLANSVEHGRAIEGLSIVELFAYSGDEETIAVVISDDGSFVERERLPHRGFGLTIARAIARKVTIHKQNGTRVEMLFAPARAQIAAHFRPT